MTGEMSDFGYGKKESEKSEADSHSVPRPRIELGTKL